MKFRNVSICLLIILLVTGGSLQAQRTYESTYPGFTDAFFWKDAIIETEDQGIAYLYNSLIFFNINESKVQVWDSSGNLLNTEGFFADYAQFNFPYNQNWVTFRSFKKGPHKGFWVGGDLEEMDAQTTHPPELYFAFLDSMGVKQSEATLWDSAGFAFMGMEPLGLHALGIMGFGPGPNPVLVKYHISDSILWQKEYPGLGSNGRVFSATPDNGLLIGNANRVVELDSSGNILWRRNVQGMDLQSVQYTPNGSLLAAGNISGLPTLMAFDTSNTVQWVWSYSDTTNLIHALCELAWNGDILLGGTRYFAPYHSYPFVIRLSPSGQVKHAMEYPADTSYRYFPFPNNFTQAGFIMALEPSRDNGYYLSSLTDQYATDYYDCVFKADSNGISGCQQQAFTVQRQAATVSVVTQPQTSIAANYLDSVPRPYIPFFASPSTTFDTIYCSNFNCSLPATITSPGDTFTVGQTALFTGNVPSTWHISDWRSPSGTILNTGSQLPYTFTQPGPHTFYYHITNNWCHGWDTITVLVCPATAPTILPSDSTLCYWDSLNLQLSGFNSYQWSNGSTQSSQTVYPPDSLSIYIIDSYGCPWSDTLEVEEIPAVVADFSVTLQGFSHLFQFLGSNATAWAWDFGDGTSAATQNTAHTYAGPGNYQVCLIASNSCGSDTLCDYVSIAAGLTPPLSDGGLKLFPNPTSEFLQLELEKPLAAVGCFNLWGQQFELKSTHLSPGTYQLDVRNLPSGVYWMEVTFLEGTTQRIQWIKL